MEYDHLLHTVLDFHGTHSADAFDSITDSYYRVKNHIYAESQWLNRERIAAYVVCYVMFIQLMIVFSLHPRLGTITLTLGKAVSHLSHFAVVFMSSFCFLAYMCHWISPPL